ncbi:MAG: hypothetical protein ACOCXQ_02095 [Patescibacteria group bacterium]
MDDRITGYILLISGVVIMLFATIQLALLVTRVIDPFPTFRFTEIFSSNAEMPQTDLTPEQRSLLSESSSFSLNPMVANEVLNFAVYFFLMAFAVNMGSKISGLGINLLRPTTIKVHPKNIEDIVQSMPNPQNAPQQPMQNKPHF